MKLGDLTWPDIAKLDRDLVAIYPVAATEQHGLHLPFLTDAILCEAVTNRIESAIPDQTLLLPVQWFGASSHHLGMAGTLTAEMSTHIALLAEPLRCLLQHGFRRMFVINGHGGNVDTMHIALRQLAMEFPHALLCGASYWDFADTEIRQTLTGTRRSVGHACEFETSIMMHLKPALVKKTERRDDDVRSLPPALGKAFVPLDMKRQTQHGAAGQPSLASAKKGARLMEQVVKGAIKAVTAARELQLPDTNASCHTQRLSGSLQKSTADATQLRRRRHLKMPGRNRVR